MSPYVVAALVTVGLLTAVWGLSVVLRNASIIDVYWGPGFVVVAAVGWALGSGGTRATLVLALVACWGLRLGGYLLWRNWGEGEDRRYRRMRRAWGERFWWVSYGTVYLLQAALLWIVSLPVQHVMASAPATPLGVLSALGVLLWALGIGFESVGDLQLARFKADPTNAGRVMDRGLWAYTRHPNYFGDFCVWWGIGLLAFATPGGLWTIIGPTVMSVLLMRVSGVPMLEGSMARRRPDYAAYQQRTSAFFPRPPRDPEAPA